MKSTIAVYGFTLIEMLVVLGIIITLSGMIFIAYEGSEVDAVTADAFELQTVLQRARSLTLSTGQSHGVIFHIENAGDGSVLKNYSHMDGMDAVGGHWYAIVGPDTTNTLYRSTKRPPMAKRNMVNGSYNFLTLEEYMQAMEDVQVGPRHYLSRGVRFLALSDYDSLYHEESDPSYPRPWFGFYDDTTNTYYPWGAYNRDLDAGFGESNTGLDYEGLNGPIPYDATLDTNVYPSEVWGRMYFEYDYPSGTGSGVTAKVASEVGGYDKSVKYHFGKSGVKVGPDTSRWPGRPCPLINGYAADFMIVFSPNGSASVAKGHCREIFLSPSHYTEDGGEVLGSIDHGMQTMEEQTGGYAIMLCRDVDPDDAGVYNEVNSLTGQPAYNKFNSVEDAYESITPFMRVFVNKLTGIAEVQNNQHPYMRIEAADLLQHDPYPRGLNK